ncbi:hypothetical protein ShirakiTB12_53940 [Priestia megaterium]|uniref:Uncharacterized protein n=1 Tax=Priestia megaterium TaxID=1404 RepID=A0AAX6BT71_PRIMG|nr:hypothetical protein [Priestia megaterium]GMG76925.1 hypothetical protein ShirakiTB12_53940 [Priestia megaterium]
MLKKLQSFLIARQKDKNDKENLSTQDFLYIEDIRDNVTITKDSKIVAILRVSAINLDLMSRNEQNYVFESFENFLGGLDDNSEIQFETIAQPVNLRSHMADLIRKHEVTTNPFKKRLLRSYIHYNDEHQTKKSVVKKEHYVIIGEKIKGKDELAYQDTLEELEQRTQDLIEEITGMLGDDFTLECEQLNNNEIVQLLQIFYNYQDAVYQPIESIDIPQFITGKKEQEGGVIVEIKKQEVV